MTTPSPMMAKPPMPVEQEPTDAGYTVEVKVSGDGRIMIGVEKPEMENNEGDLVDNSGGDDVEQYQEVGSIEEACRVLRDIYRAAGNTADVREAKGNMAEGYAE